MSMSKKERRNWLALAEAMNDQAVAQYVDRLDGKDDEYLESFLRVMQYVSDGKMDLAELDDNERRCVFELGIIGAVTVVRQLTLRSDEELHDDDAAL